MANMEVEESGVVERGDKHDKLHYAAFKLVAWLAECRRSHELVCLHWRYRDEHWRDGTLGHAESYRVHQQVFRRASFCEVAQRTLFDSKLAGSQDLHLTPEPRPWDCKVADPVQMVCVRMNELLKPIPATKEEGEVERGLGRGHGLHWWLNEALLQVALKEGRPYKCPESKVLKGF